MVTDDRPTTPAPETCVAPAPTPRPGSHQAGRELWPALRPEPVREEDVVGMAAETHLGTAVLSYLLSGPILFGGLAWLVGRVTGLDWLVAVGVLAGMALSMYIIWLRYGKPQASAGRPATTPTPAHPTHSRSNE